MNEIPESIVTALSLIFRFVLNYFWLIILGFVVIKFIRRKSAHKKMQEMAVRFGLEFQGRASLQQEIEKQIASNVQQQTIESQKALNFLSKALEYILPMFYHWEIKGKWNGVPVRIYSESKGGRNGSRYTVVRAATESTRNLGLQIIAESFLSTVGKAFSGNTDITSGNEDLDKKILVKAAEPDQAKMVLSSPYLQDALRQAFEFSSSIHIDDHWVSFNYPGNLENEEKLRSALDHVSRTALALRSPSR